MVRGLGIRLALCALVLGIGTVARGHRLQEAIWTLQAAGHDATMLGELRQHLRRHLETAPILRIEEHGGGCSHTRRIYLEHDISAIAKHQRSSDNFFCHYPAEIAAYEIDELLGFDLVPTTVARVIDGVESSLQYYVRDAVIGEIEDFRFGTDYDVGFEQLYLFDFLTHNIDRKGANWLRRPGGHLVAIDHGFLYRHADAAYEAFIGEWHPRIHFPHPEILIPGPLYDRVAALTAEQLRPRLARWVPEEFIGLMLRRRDEVMPRLRKRPACPGALLAGAAALGS